MCGELDILCVIPQFAVFCLIGLLHRRDDDFFLLRLHRLQHQGIDLQICVAKFSQLAVALSISCIVRQNNLNVALLHLVGDRDFNCCSGVINSGIFCGIGIHRHVILCSIINQDCRLNSCAVCLFLRAVRNTDRHRYICVLVGAKLECIIAIIPVVCRYIQAGNLCGRSILVDNKFQLVHVVSAVVLRTDGNDVSTVLQVLICNDIICALRGLIQAGIVITLNQSIVILNGDIIQARRLVLDRNGHVFAVQNPIVVIFIPVADRFVLIVGLARGSICLIQDIAAGRSGLTDFLQFKFLRIADVICRHYGDLSGKDLIDISLRDGKFHKSAVQRLYRLILIRLALQLQSDIDRTGAIFLSHKIRIVHRQGGLRVEEVAESQEVQNFVALYLQSRRGHFRCSCVDEQVARIVGLCVAALVRRVNGQHSQSVFIALCVKGVCPDPRRSTGLPIGNAVFDFISIDSHLRGKAVLIGIQPVVLDRNGRNDVVAAVGKPICLFARILSQHLVHMGVLICHSDNRLSRVNVQLFGVVFIRIACLV